MNELKPTFLASPYAGPLNEYVEEFDGSNLRGRILYAGTEVATLSYAESHEWGELYATAPELVAALEGLINCHTGAPWQTVEVRRQWWLKARAAIAKAKGEH